MRLSCTLNLRNGLHRYLRPMWLLLLAAYTLGACPCWTWPQLINPYSSWCHPGKRHQHYRSQVQVCCHPLISLNAQKREINHTLACTLSIFSIRLNMYAIPRTQLCAYCRCVNTVWNHIRKVSYRSQPTKSWQHLYHVLCSFDTEGGGGFFRHRRNAKPQLKDCGPWVNPRFEYESSCVFPSCRIRSGLKCTPNMSYYNHQLRFWPFLFNRVWEVDWLSTWCMSLQGKSSYV